MEHVVSRADLARTDTSPSASPSPSALAKFQGLAALDFVAPQTSNTDEPEGAEDADEGLEFQLFAAPKTAGDAKHGPSGEVHRIRLRSPSLDPERVGFIRPDRRREYYFATPLSANELESAALSGEQILARARAPWPGMAYAWKVLRVPASGVPRETRLDAFRGLTGDVEAKKRTRPGKKCRVKRRKRLVASRAQREVERAAEEAREVAEREKRTRRNREKKVKRKAKERAKKDGVGGEAVEGDGGGTVG